MIVSTFIHLEFQSQQNECFKSHNVTNGENQTRGLVTCSVVWFTWCQKSNFKITCGVIDMKSGYNYQQCSNFKIILCYCWLILWPSERSCGWLAQFKKTKQKIKISGEIVRRDSLSRHERPRANWLIGWKNKNSNFSLLFLTASNYYTKNWMICRRHLASWLDTCFEANLMNFLLLPGCFWFLICGRWID